MTEHGHTWIVVDGVTFVAWPDHGCYVQQGASPADVGALYIPMNADGSADQDNVSEIEVAYEDA